MQVSEVNERINCEVDFYNGKVQPVWFVWDGKKISVKQVTYTWKTRKGDAEVLHFAAVGGSAYYELSFNAADMMWKLEKVGVE